MPGKEKDRQRRNNDGHDETFRFHKDMEQKNVNDDRSEEQQSQRQKAATQYEEGADELERHDHLEVSSGEEGGRELSRGSLWRWRHGDEIKKTIQAGENKQSTQQNPSYDCGDFH